MKRSGCSVATDAAELGGRPRRAAPTSWLVRRPRGGRAPPTAVAARPLVAGGCTPAAAPPPGRLPAACVASVRSPPAALRPYRTDGPTAAAASQSRDRFGLYRESALPYSSAMTRSCQFGRAPVVLGPEAVLG